MKDSNYYLTLKFPMNYSAAIISLEHRPCTRLVCFASLVLSTLKTLLTFYKDKIMAGFPSVKKGNKIGEKAKRPKPGIPLDKSTLLELIKKHGGNLSRVADALGTTRGCVRRRCDTDKDLGEALEDARERSIDELERSCWDDAIGSKDTALRCFLLKTQAKHRGYDQDEAKNAAKDIATAAFDFIVSKQPKA